MIIIRFQQICKYELQLKTKKLKYFEHFYHINKKNRVLKNGDLRYLLYLKKKKIEIFTKM